MSSRTDQENVSNKHFRYLVDRAFSVKGIGTVVTGSLQSGTTSINDHVAISSNGVSARIRGIRIDGENISTIESGQRAALNIDSDLDDIVEVRVVFEDKTNAFCLSCLAPLVCPHIYHNSANTCIINKNFVCQSIINTSKAYLHNTLNFLSC